MDSNNYYSFWNKYTELCVLNNLIYYIILGMTDIQFIMYEETND